MERADLADMSKSYGKHRDYWMKKRRLSHRYIEILDGMLSEPLNVMDLGCGGGRLSLLLADKVEKIVGVDISEDLIEGARESAKELGKEGLAFLAGDLRDPGTWEGAREEIDGLRFDLLVSNLMIRKDTCDIMQVLGDSYRNLAVDSKLCYRIQEASDLRDLGVPSPCYSQKEVVEACGESGFREIDVEEEMFHQRFSSADFVLKFLDRTHLIEHYRKTGALEKIKTRLKRMEGKRGVTLQRHYLILTATR